MITTKYLQAIAIRNRQELAGLYDYLECAKLNRKFYDTKEDLPNEYFWHNKVTQLKQEIKKLVEIQCAVKNEIRYEVASQRKLRKAIVFSGLEVG